MRLAAAIVDMMFFLVLFAIVNYTFATGDFTKSEHADEILMIEMSSDFHAGAPRFSDVTGAPVKIDVWVVYKDRLLLLDNVYQDVVYTHQSSMSRLSTSFHSNAIDKFYLVVSSISPQYVAQDMDLSLTVYVGAERALCNLFNDKAFRIGYHSLVVFDAADPSECVAL